ncbi:unnamed protein product [Lathyrus sativus]|nr:unnamed protein product [Lathyrus sativus]
MSQYVWKKKPSNPSDPRGIFLVHAKNWNHSLYGYLSMKDAYLHLVPAGQHVPWSSTLWNLAIPPSKSLLV